MIDMSRIRINVLIIEVLAFILAMVALAMEESEFAKLIAVGMFTLSSQMMDDNKE